LEQHKLNSVLRRSFQSSRDVAYGRSLKNLTSYQLKSRQSKIFPIFQLFVPRVSLSLIKSNPGDTDQKQETKVDSADISKDVLQGQGACLTINDEEARNRSIRAQRLANGQDISKQIKEKQELKAKSKLQ